jgi:LPXTG-motif cell wall-anchored protein
LSHLPSQRDTRIVTSPCISPVRFLVNPAGKSDVTAFDETIKADDEGKASVNVYGTSADDPSAYVGDYDVTVTCGDDELTGDFSVEKDPNAGGGDEDGNEDGNGDGGNGGDNGNGGGDLPRTGTELTGLVGGAGLLLIGGVAVALTMRRKKVSQDPSEI